MPHNGWSIVNKPVAVVHGQYSTMRNDTQVVELKLARSNLPHHQAIGGIGSVYASKHLSCGDGLDQIMWTILLVRSIGFAGAMAPVSYYALAACRLRILRNAL